MTATLSVWRNSGAWFWLSFLLSVLFLFFCNITLWTFSPWQTAAQLKEYGVLSGVIVAFFYLAIKAFQGTFLVKISPVKVWSYFLPIALLLEILLLGQPHLASHGLLFAQLSSGFWWADYPGEYAILLKRAVVPALAHLCGFNESTYVYFWLLLYFLACWLAIRWLVEIGFTFLECFSILTSSIFAYWLIAPGYSEVLVFIGALYCLQRPTSLLEKLVIFTLALGTHEVAACLVFSSVLLASHPRDREEWLSVLLLMVPANVVVGIVNQHLQGSARPGESLVAGGHLVYWYLFHRPIAALAGIMVAYKLYWLPVIGFGSQSRYRWLTCGVLLSLPLVALGTDTSRLVQFSSLAMLLLVSKIVADWSPKSRNLLAGANLIVPSFYCAINSPVLWGWGLYSLYMRLISLTGFHLGHLWLR